MQRDTLYPADGVWRFHFVWQLAEGPSRRISGFLPVHCAHPDEGFGAVVGEIAVKRLLQKPVARDRKGKKKGKRAKQRPMTLVSNPLSQLSDEEGSSSSGGED